MKRTICLFTSILVFFCCGTMAWAGPNQVLKVVSPWKVKALDLTKSGFLFARMGCVEMLTTTDDQGNLKGFLAESWDVGPDRLTWTFKLRPNVFFHDQTPLTAAAAAKSLTISLKGKGVLSHAGIEDIQAQGPLTLAIKTREPFSALPAYLAHYSAGIISEASFDSAGKVTQVLGTGQYKVADYQGGILVKFQSAGNYWAEASGISSTEYHAVPKGETRGFMIKAGQADMAFTLSPSDAVQLTSAGQTQVSTLTIPRVRLMLLNCSLPIFSDVRTRQAMSLALDRKGIATALLRNPDSAATQLLPPAVAMWHSTKLPPLEQNIRTAKELLSKAGWQPGPDGVRMKDGKPFEFTLNTYASRPMLPPVATAIQDQLKQVGIKMNIVVGESSLIPEKHKDGTLEAALIARNFGMIPDAIGTIYSDYGPNPGAWGALGWQSDRLNQLLKEYLATFDAARNKTLRHEILSVLQSELPVIPVTWYEHIVAVGPRVKDVNIDPFEIKSYIKGADWAD